jgi:glutamine synthetase
MAKPYGDCSGSGMHIHASLNDGAGKNVLARPEGGPADTLLHAVAGLLAAMPETMLAFAPTTTRSAASAPMPMRRSRQAGGSTIARPQCG